MCSSASIPKRRPRWCRVTACFCAILYTAVSLQVVPRASAQLPVTDVGAIGHLAATEINNITRHLEDVAKYVEMVNNQIEQLRRLGDPNTYIGMLGLDKLQDELTNIRQGIGRSIAEVQAISNGVNALQYTANGLYRDLTNLPDRFGNQMRWDYQQFKQFDTVGQLATQYTTDLTAYNQTMSRMGREYKLLLAKLNGAGSQIESEKIMGEMQAVQNQMNVAGQLLHASSERFQVQANLNQQMAARDAQAQQQINAQEARSETSAMIQQLAAKYPTQ